MLKKLWETWLDGGFIRGKKRYVIAPVIWALLIPLGIWLFGNEGMSYLDYIQQ